MSNSEGNLGPVERRVWVFLLASLFLGLLCLTIASCAALSPYAAKAATSAAAATGDVLTEATSDGVLTAPEIERAVSVGVAAGLASVEESATRSATTGALAGAGLGAVVLRLLARVSKFALPLILGVVTK